MMKKCHKQLPGDTMHFQVTFKQATGIIFQKALIRMKIYHKQRLSFQWTKNRFENNRNTIR